jgi:multidrug efflux pump
MDFVAQLVRRPVLAMVINLAIVLLGVGAGFTLPVQEFPQTVSATITVNTAYYGADAETVAGFITSPIEGAVAQTNGVDCITSVSVTGLSTVSLTLRLNYDPNKAMTEVQSAINSVTNQLPQGFQQPVITVSNSSTLDVLPFGFYSDKLTPEQVNDYVVRVVQPQLQAVAGVQLAQVQGSPNIALRAWLDPERLAAYGLTANDVAAALQANDYVTGVGSTLGGMTYVNLAITTGLHTEAEFRNLIIKQVKGVLVHLSDVAKVEYGPDSTNTKLSASAPNLTGSVVSIHLTPTANLLTTIRDLTAVFEQIKPRLPHDIHASILYNAADFVQASLREVALALLQALAVVTLVVFLFLGSPRSVFVPLTTIPLSLIGNFAIMAAFGFSINLLTLLALVLATGLVVDDAIIIVENVHRHLAAGKSPRDSAIAAARELAGPIVAITIVLLAAYVPVGLQKGLTGALFTEFAFTLAGSVTISAVVALTLSPMMCSQLLKPSDHTVAAGWRGRVSRLGDRAVAAVERGYRSLLTRTLQMQPLVLVLGLLIAVSIVPTFLGARHELAPKEDTGVIYLSGASAPSATLDQITRYDDQIQQAFADIPEKRDYWLVDQPNSIFAGLVLAPWDERQRSASEIQRTYQTDLNKVAGLELGAYQSPFLPGASGVPIQFVLKGAGSVETLNEVSDEILAAARESGIFTFIDKDLKVDQPQVTITVDRDRLAELGLDMSVIGNSLKWLLGGGYVNYFSLDQHAYRVMPMASRNFRLNASQILDYPIATINGVPVPLSAVAHLSQQVLPEQINHFQQLNSATLSGGTVAGVTDAQAYAVLQDAAKRFLPDGFATDTTGPLREYVTEAGSFLPGFGFALLVIYLALVALFESFRDPLVILAAVPMSIAGALLFIWMGVGGSSVNLFSEIGLVTLAGLISKHGILIVEVANEQQRLGFGKREAIIKAAAVRLRPILMTTAAMVLGVMPLVWASGAGASSRFVIGLVIATGLSVGTLITLFIVPAVYLALAAKREAPKLRHSDAGSPSPVALRPSATQGAV